MTYPLIFLTAPILPHQVAGTKFVNKPIIVSKTENYGIEGKQLELTCSVECELGTKLTIRWELPNEGIAEKVRFSLDDQNIANRNDFNDISGGTNTRNPADS